MRASQTDELCGLRQIAVSRVIYSLAIFWPGFQKTMSKCVYVPAFNYDLRKEEWKNKAHVHCQHTAHQPEIRRDLVQARHRHFTSSLIPWEFKLRRLRELWFDFSVMHHLTKVPARKTHFPFAIFTVGFLIQKIQIQQLFLNKSYRRRQRLPSKCLQCDTKYAFFPRFIT